MRTQQEIEAKISELQLQYNLWSSTEELKRFHAGSLPVIKARIDALTWALNK